MAAGAMLGAIAPFFISQLKNVGEAGKTIPMAAPQKRPRKHSLHAVNDHFEFPRPPTMSSRKISLIRLGENSTADEH